MRSAIDQVLPRVRCSLTSDELVGAPSSATPGKDGDASTVGGMVTPGPGTTPGKVGGVSGGNYPVLVLPPMALFSPGITTADRSKVVEGEDNGVRQMCE